MSTPTAGVISGYHARLNAPALGPRLNSAAAYELLTGTLLV
jgi:DNA-binding Lrp family transcriptional regulator